MSATNQSEFLFDAVTFDVALSEEAKQEGMAAAAISRAELLELAREIAVVLARRNGEVHADDVQKVLILRGYTSADLGNAAGSIFRGPEKSRKFEWTGRFTKSERVCAHRNLLRVWRLK